MNTYSKLCPNVYLAKCAEKHERGEVIEVTTKYGKENECVVHNLIYERDGYFFYSITRADGFNAQQRAQNKAERLMGAAANAERKANERYSASKEGADFLRLGEPIKVGHHSEKRHRALIERNQNRFAKFVELSDAAQEYEQRAAYWQGRANDINLSMPESVEYYAFKLQQAQKEHAEIKANPAKRVHSYSLTYAKKAVNEAEKNLAVAKRLWA